MRLDLNHFSNSLQKDTRGIWIGPKQLDVSYPAHGHSSCMQVESSSFWFKHRNDCIKTVVDLFPPQGEIWDIGGGNGFVAKFLQDCGYKTVLLEPGPNGADNGKIRGLEHVVCADLNGTEFNADSFSSAGLFDVLEHIENEDQFLKRLHSLMKPSGRIYLTTPAYDFLWSAEDVYAGHFRRYTKGSLCRVLEKNGFKINFASYIFFFLPIPIFFLRALPFWISKNKIDTPSVETDHQAKDSLVKKIILRVLSFENKIISKRKSVPFGGSLLIAAEKI